MNCKDLSLGACKVLPLYTTGKKNYFTNILEFFFLLTRDVYIWQFTPNRVDSYCFGLFKMGFILKSWDTQHADLAD